MVFNSATFFIFFPLVTILYFSLPYRWRWSLLLVASCIFYMAFIPQYILVLLTTIIVDYIAGIYIEKSSGQKRKIWLIVSIASTCTILFFFKYFNFFNVNLGALASLLHWNYSLGYLNIILPIGLSFHTFQSLSYIIEVYRGRQKAEYHFGIYALYVMFYPQLVAGPIERPQNLLPQFYEKHDFDYVRVVGGLQLMLWGLFEKVVIADNLAIVTNHVYTNPVNFSGWSLILAASFFAVQIYCDFAGYSNIAIGAARVMGFRLMRNFDRPFMAKSITELWTRWHISLSTWFRDYIYIPLGGNRGKNWRAYFNILVTFCLVGLWHGANWTFVVWGALNGLFIVLEKMTERWRGKIIFLIERFLGSVFSKVVQVALTFSLFSFAGIFFRARNLEEAWYIVSHLFVGLGEFSIFSLGVTKNSFIFICSLIFGLLFINLGQRQNKLQNYIGRSPFWLRWSIYYIVIGSIVWFLNVSPKFDFIYFQF